MSSKPCLRFDQFRSHKSNTVSSRCHRVYAERFLSSIPLKSDKQPSSEHFKSAAVIGLTSHVPLLRHNARSDVGQHVGPNKESEENGRNDLAKLERSHTVLNLLFQRGQSENHFTCLYNKTPVVVCGYLPYAPAGVRGITGNLASRRCQNQPGYNGEHSYKDLLFPSRNLITTKVGGSEAGVHDMSATLIAHRNEYKGETDGFLSAIQHHPDRVYLLQLLKQNRFTPKATSWDLSMAAHRCGGTVGTPASVGHTTRHRIYSYDPELLMRTERGAVVDRKRVTLPGWMASTIAYTTTDDVEKRLDDQFATSFPTIAISYTKVKSLKRSMGTVARQAGSVDAWTLALAFVFLEKLLLLGVVGKSTRKAYAAAALLLSAKVNDLAKHDVPALITALAHTFKLDSDEVIRAEVQAFLDLEMTLHVPDLEVQPHYLAITATSLGVPVPQPFDTNV